MKKLLIFLLIAVVGYFTVGVVAWRLLPAKISEAERKRAGVTLALERIVNDQLLVSRRFSEISEKTLDRGRSKAEQVSAFLADPELNRMALTYMGADWSVVRSSFIGSVRHTRALLTMQKDERRHYVSRLNQKVEELEARKRQLSRRMRAPSDERNWRIEYNDVERQLSYFRATNTYREYLEKDITADREVEAKAKNEEAIYQLAVSCEEQTIGQLTRIMAEQAAFLRQEESNVDTLRYQMSLFNIWPLNRMADMPL